MNTMSAVPRLAVCGLAAAVLTGCLHSSTRPPEPAPRDAPPIELGDVLMRSLRVWPKDERDARDTLTTAKAFRVDRILWIYENTPEYNTSVRAEGIGIGTTMSANARESWLRTLSKDEIQAMVDRYTIRNLAGEQVLPEHMQRFGTSAWVTHFQPDQTNPEWLRFYVDYVATRYDTGIDSIHRDDPAICAAAPRSGGSFTDSVAAYFRRHLQAHFTAEQLADMGVEDVATFDVREHFKARGAPATPSLWAWRGSPLMPVYLQAMQQADRDFFLAVRAGVEQRTGRRIPWSLNASGPKSPEEDAFDFRIGEFQSHLNQPQSLLLIAEQARRADKPQALVSMVDRKWETLPDFVPDLRRHIATAYATGMIPLVPWCMYMHDAPRYYGTVEDFGDLFLFVSEHRDLFDGHDLTSASGIDTLARLYSWEPNREMVFADGDPSARIWLNRPNIFAFARRRPDAPRAVIHLVDWNPEPEPFDITFSPAGLVGTRTAKLTLLRPGQPPQMIPAYLGDTLRLPAATPWGLVVAEPADIPGEGPAAPRILSPARAVVPSKSPIAFYPPETGTAIVARFVPDGSPPDAGFAEVQPAAPVIVERGGTVEAYSLDARTGARSGTIRIRFDTYRDLAAPAGERASAPAAVDLSGRFSAPEGKMKAHASFLAREMILMGKKVERGISTLGDTTLSCPIDPGWKYFSVRVGIDDAEDRRPCARFQVLFDNRIAHETPIVNPTKSQLADEERREFLISLRIPPGAKTLQLRSVNSGFFPAQNTILWAEPTAHAAAGSAK